MSTAHLQATDAVMAALRTAPAVADKIARGRAVPAQMTSGTCAFVRLHRSSGNRLALDGTCTTWITAIAIEIGARAAADGDAHEAVDPVLQAAFTRIEQLATAGVLDWAGDPEIHWQIDEADTTVGLAAIVLPIKHIAGPTLAPYTNP